MDQTFDLISEQTLSSSQSSIVFNNIPQSYKDLYIIISSRGTNNAINDSVAIRFNNSSSNLSGKNIFGWPGGSPTVGSQNNSEAGTTNGNTSSANTFGNLEIYIPNYSSSQNKLWSSNAVMGNNATQAFITITAGSWASTESINNITFLPITGGNFVSGSTFYLYGIKNSDDGGRGFFGPAMTGGDEVYTTGNGYKVHVFKNSGTLNVTAPGEVEYLVVAGGGGGGCGRGGGGGAGGYRTGILNLTTTQNYSVIIGSGGAGATSFSNRGGSGSNSIIGSITSNGGGGGGAYNDTASLRDGISGGSGGGSGHGPSSGIGGSALPAGQGNPGGNSSSNSIAGAGGGGAGAAGTNVTTANIGSPGGAGISTNISGSSVTYAGGGGGGGEPAGAGGSGGGGTGSIFTGSPNANSGTINTGGGGGGGAAGSNIPGAGGSGGSGIVIIRYRI